MSLYCSDNERIFSVFSTAGSSSLTSIFGSSDWGLTTSGLDVSEEWKEPERDLDFENELEFDAGTEGRVDVDLTFVNSTGWE